MPRYQDGYHRSKSRTSRRERSPSRERLYDSPGRQTWNNGDRGRNRSRRDYSSDEEFPSKRSRRAEREESRLTRRVKEEEQDSNVRDRRTAASAAETSSSKPTSTFTDTSINVDDNPFNDPNIDQKFVWVKKRDRDKKRGLSSSDQSKRDTQNHEETKTELEKLMKRRTEREIEMQLREQEMIRLQREADRAALGDWENRERDFLLEQTKKRACIRVRERRPKAIDSLVVGLQLLEEGDQVQDEWLAYHINDPIAAFEAMAPQQLSDTRKEIQTYVEHEQNAMALRFWKALTAVADDLIEQKERPGGAAPVGVNDSVYQEVTQMLSKRSLNQLLELEKGVESKVNSGAPIDSEYWDTLRNSLKIWKARRTVSELHADMLRQRKRVLDTRKIHPESFKQVLDRAWAQEGVTEPERNDGRVSHEESNHTSRDTSEGPRDLPDSTYDVMRRFAHDAGKGEKDVEADVIAMQKRFGTEMGPDEEVFMDEAFVGTQTYGWSDKYRPRKPRYFNRVHTGYEWNKYNQTHYDSENPPPKVVQGYKFNLFYPDLIDRKKTPTYRIERDPAHANNGPQDTVIIRFVAGPPYEDIAFRIVNREWEYSHKKGFRCSFDRGVLQLHFHFKRHYYRR